MIHPEIFNMHTCLVFSYSVHWHSTSILFQNQMLNIAQKPKNQAQLLRFFIYFFRIKCSNRSATYKSIQYINLKYIIMKHLSWHCSWLMANGARLGNFGSINWFYFFLIIYRFINKYFLYVQCSHINIEHFCSNDQDKRI